MYKHLSDPVAIDAVNQFFNDLISLADSEQQLQYLRPQVENFRIMALTHSAMRRTQDQLRGFLSGLVVAGVLTPEQGSVLSQRLNAGCEAGWL